MLSRVANSLFWLNRYIERAENYARFITVNINLTLDLPPGLTEQWHPLVITSGDEDLFKELYGVETKQDVIRFLTTDRRNPNSIISCLSGARENARSIRENLSTDLWEHLNKFYLDIKESVVNDKAIFADPAHFFDKVKCGCQLFYGIMDSTISHGEGWHFGRMGRFLERADKTARIIDVKYYILLPQTADVGTTLDVVQWSALLKSASAFIMYRKHYGKIVARNTMEFLILDRKFPRAIRHCVNKAEQSLHEITGVPMWNFSNSAEKQLGVLRSDLDFTDIEDIIKFGLHEYVDDFQKKMNEAGIAIHQSFFI